MNKTAIGWTGMTWNPTTGCDKVSAGCKNCYAEKLFPRVYPGRAFTDVQLHDDRLAQPIRKTKSQIVFVNSMSDLFHESIPFSYIAAVFYVMMITPHHTYQVLTKRPQRMHRFFTWIGEVASRSECVFPADSYSWRMYHCLRAKAIDYGITEAGDAQVWPLPNVWLGVSVENNQQLERITPLLLTTAALRFVSVEPLLEEISLEPFLYVPTYCYSCGSTRSYYDNDTASGEPGITRCWNCYEEATELAPLQWVIVGGESGDRIMEANWVRRLRDSVRNAKVPFFFKQWGTWIQSSQMSDEAYNVAKQGDFTTREVNGNLYYKIGKRLSGNKLDGKWYEEMPTETLYGRIEGWGALQPRSSDKMK